MAPQPMNAKRTLDILSSGHAPLSRVDLLTFITFQCEGNDHDSESWRVKMAAGQEMIACVMIGEGSVQCNGTTFTKAELLKDTSAMFWVYLCVYIVLVLFAGQF